YLVWFRGGAKGSGRILDLLFCHRSEHNCWIEKYRTGDGRSCTIDGGLDTCCLLSSETPQRPAWLLWFSESGSNIRDRRGCGGGVGRVKQGAWLSCYRCNGTAGHNPRF